MIKRTFVAVLLLLASLALTAQELSGNYEQLFKEGITAFDNQDFETAAKLRDEIKAIKEKTEGEV